MIDYTVNYIVHILQTAWSSNRMPRLSYITLEDIDRTTLELTGWIRTQLPDPGQALNVAQNSSPTRCPRWTNIISSPAKITSLKGGSDMQCIDKELCLAPVSASLKGVTRVYLPPDGLLLRYVMSQAILCDHFSRKMNPSFCLCLILIKNAITTSFKY